MCSNPPSGKHGSGRIRDLSICEIEEEEEENDATLGAQMDNFPNARLNDTDLKKEVTSKDSKIIFTRFASIKGKILQ